MHEDRFTSIEVRLVRIEGRLTLLLWLMGVTLVLLCLALGGIIATLIMLTQR
jgi:hypothetical protein